MQRSFPSPWGILVNPCPELGTPGAPLDLALSVQQMLPSARLPASASTTTKDFGADFLTAHVLAVYASHPSGHPVEWQDSLPGCQLRLCPGWTFTNQIPSKGFLYSGLIPPFPSFAWRDSPNFSSPKKTFRYKPLLQCRLGRKKHCLQQFSVWKFDQMV